MKSSTRTPVGSWIPIRPVPVQNPAPGMVTVPRIVVTAPLVLKTSTVPVLRAVALSVSPEAKVAANVARVEYVPPEFVVVATTTLPVPS